MQLMAVRGPLFIENNFPGRKYYLCFKFFSFQEAAQALIYAGMAGSSLENIQEKINEYLERVQALHSAGG